jgi:NAD(P)-dependent dehydrogenase (short-subunit alcohol dehydrogenase family)/adenine/guanine phosphoribosyltransferase-like PRPP-binding protein
MSISRVPIRSPRTARVYSVRKAIGAQLAIESPVEADLIVPVPDSGVPAAIGYAQQSGIPFELGIIRSHYVGRTFIQPGDKVRHLGVKLKHNANRELIKGKRVVLVDDSIVRGTTSLKIVQMMHEAGAAEVHMRIASPPTRHSCFYGVDTPERAKLLAAKLDVGGMTDFIHADSLAFISIDGLYKALGEAHRADIHPKYCDACFTGEYPTTLTDQDENGTADRPVRAAPRTRRLILPEFDDRRTARRRVSRSSPARAAASAPLLAQGTGGRGRARRADRAHRGRARGSRGSDLRRSGGSATIAPMDLTENDSIARLAEAVSERWKALDVLVLNAATLGSLSAVPAIDFKEFAKVLTLNVTAQAAILAAFDPRCSRRRQQARVIGVTSSVGRMPRAYWGSYGASKAAFENLLLSYGEEVAHISKRARRDRRSRRDPHQDARARLSGRGSGDGEGSGSGGRSDRGARPPRGSKPGISNGSKANPCRGQLTSPRREQPVEERRPRLAIRVVAGLVGRGRDGDHHFRLRIDADRLAEDPLGAEAALGIGPPLIAIAEARLADIGL